MQSLEFDDDIYNLPAASVSAMAAHASAVALVCGKELYIYDYLAGLFTLLGRYDLPEDVLFNGKVEQFALSWPAQRTRKAFLRMHDGRIYQTGTQCRARPVDFTIVGKWFDHLYGYCATISNAFVSVSMMDCGRDPVSVPIDIILDDVIGFRIVSTDVHQDTCTVIVATRTRIYMRTISMEGDSAPWRIMDLESSVNEFDRLLATYELVHDQDTPSDGIHLLLSVVGMEKHIVEMVINQTSFYLRLRDFGYVPDLLVMTTTGRMHSFHRVAGFRSFHFDHNFDYHTVYNAFIDRRTIVAFGPVGTLVACIGKYGDIDTYRINALGFIEYSIAQKTRSCETSGVERNCLAANISSGTFVPDPRIPNRFYLFDRNKVMSIDQTPERNYWNHFEERVVAHRPTFQNSSLRGVGWLDPGDGNYVLRRINHDTMKTNAKQLPFHLDGITGFSLDPSETFMILSYEDTGTSVYVYHLPTGTLISDIYSYFSTAIFADGHGLIYYIGSESYVYAASKFGLRKIQTKSCPSHDGHINHYCFDHVNRRLHLSLNKSKELSKCVLFPELHIWKDSNHHLFDDETRDRIYTLIVIHCSNQSSLFKMVSGVAFEKIMTELCMDSCIWTNRYHK